MPDENGNRETAGEPGNRSSPARPDGAAGRPQGAGEAECLAGTGAAGHTGPEDAAMAGVHGSAADGAGARSMPGDPAGTGSSDVPAEKPRAGAYYGYIKLEDLVHEES